MAASTHDPGRRQALLQAKLRGLARSRLGASVDQALPAALPWGSALAVDGTAWVLAEDEAPRSLGPALAWALAQSAQRLVLIVTDGAGQVARQASFFEFPVEVLKAEGRDLQAVSASATPAEPPLHADARSFETDIERAGAEVVIEHGRLLGEVKGLEVARVEVGPDGGAVLGVGVGKHDRDAHQMVGRSDPAGRLFEVVRTVVEHRVPDGQGHAAYHLASERWLRWVLVRHPGEVGATRLHVVPSTVPRHDLRSPAPAPAAGVDGAGNSVLVVCSTGVDLGFVPAAVDAWQVDGRKPRLVLAVPQGDDHRVTLELAAVLSVPAEIVAVRADWRAI
ncbi:MAG: hypothetical protein ACR2H3_03570 [Acidimicrobiales bacterium]